MASLLGVMGHRVDSSLSLLLCLKLQMSNHK